MFLDIILLLLGLGILIYGAEKLVDGGSVLAARLNVPNMVIGLTVVAFGTSSPELVVSVMAAIKGESDIAFGNVLGSNLFNLLAILGLTATIQTISIKKNTTRIEVPLTVISAVIILMMFMNNYWSAPQQFTISRPEGIILLLCFGGFMFYTFQLARKGESENIPIKSYSSGRAVFYIIIGLTGLIAGGKFLVDSAVNIASALGISQRIIALTIVSIGTSLPELATSIIAARKKNTDMAIGNVLGSNIFNVFLILGISSAISPINISLASLFDITLNIIASLMVFLFIFTGKGRKISRTEGILLLTTYIAYLLFLIFYP
ncbi:calcium/sodium antiporter [Odoribacter sp. OttesenSCG-928-J03]|nr:calcium/sodium antiporter [Odoribacter sp. OttesenSCG-928-J03]